MKGFLLIVIFLLTGCVFPEDPENSFEEAQKSGLKVGVVKNPPYTTVYGEAYGGSEIEFIRDFAEKEHLDIDFVEGSESNLIEDLENYRLHMIVGGFTKNTIWKKKAGITASYDAIHVFLIPKGENRLLGRLEAYILPEKSRQ